MKDRSLFIILFALVLTIIGVSLFVFFSKDAKKQVADKPSIAVTIFPVYDIVKNIAGDKAEVNLILPIGTSEHTFDPSPLDVARHQQSRLVFKIGQGLDDWVEKVIDKKILRVDLSSSVNLIENIEEKNTFDPHYWLSVDNALLIANKAKIELVKIDPTNQDYYEENLLSYNKQLIELQEYIDLKLLDEKGKGIITFHEAFGYLANDYGIKILTTIEPYPGKEPTPAYLAEVRDIIEEYKVKVLFKEPQLSSTLLSSFTGDFGITILTLDPIGGGSETNSYISLMKYNADAIKKGLNL